MITAILFISMGTMAFAQKDEAKKHHKTPEEKAQKLAAALEKKLALTADQKAKIYTISLNGINEVQKNHVKGQKPDRTAMKAEFEKRDQQISAVLNDTQRKAYQEWKIEKMKSMKEHGRKNKKGDTQKV